MILHQLVDYETLRVVWWVLLGVILIGFATMDGFDLGVGMLLPFVARTDIERRVAINTIGPVWEGNQVWLIVGGGAIFAAWPPLYAVSFSGFYLAMFAILAALMLRPLGFKYRSQKEDPAWRSRWDWALFVGSSVPSLIFGVAVGNVLQGVPFRFDGDLRIFYEGTFLALLNPFALLCGLLSIAMLVMHGAAWLGVKATGAVADRAASFGRIAAVATICLFASGGAWVWYGIDGYALTGPAVTNGVSNPLAKTVAREAGAWFANYSTHAWTLIAPACGIVGALGAIVGLSARWEVGTLLLSKLSIFGIVSTVGVSMFPFILPSSLDPKSSLTVWDASSSHQTLFNMLVVTAVLLPCVVAYTAFVYRVLWGKIDEDAIRNDSGHAY